ncbi:hypothetical protein AHF37_07683 [Paragonimus kellicotti]|nr:hypothetical protein AHF37_07683 [Paragonimus kellicotti]
MEVTFSLITLATHDRRDSGSNMPNQPPPPYYPDSNNVNIPAQEQFTSDAFSDKSVRRAFIRKTLALSYMAGTISAFHRIEAVLIALIMTILLCLAITLFAVQTRWDFTVCSGFILVASVCVFLVGLACLIVNFTLGTNRMLVYDTQRVIGGRKYDLDEEEYIFGAMQLYVDVVMIFVALLGLSGSQC